MPTLSPHSPSIGYFSGKRDGKDVISWKGLPCIGLGTDTKHTPARNTNLCNHQSRPFLHPQPHPILLLACPSFITPSSLPPSSGYTWKSVKHWKRKYCKIQICLWDFYAEWMEVWLETISGLYHAVWPGFLHVKLSFARQKCCVKLQIVTTNDYYTVNTDKITKTFFAFICRIL